MEGAFDKKSESVYLTETVVVGSDFHRKDRSNPSVVLVDEGKKIRKIIIDSTGNIRNFPGIIKEDFWSNVVDSNLLQPRVFFRFSFEKRENKWVALWTIQPDGRYWEDDDGFGAEKDEEIILYTYLDVEGEFTSPFRVYRVGNRGYSLERFQSAYAGWFNRALQEIHSGKRQSRWVEQIYPQLFYPELSPIGQWYSFIDKVQVIEFWNDPILSKSLLEITEVLLYHDGSISEIIGYYPFSGLSLVKTIHASVTLFFLITGETVFKKVLDKFYDGELDDYTHKRLSN